MSYDAVLEQALEASQAKERELAKQVASLQERDQDRLKRIGDLRRELAEARHNIGELNSMLHSVDDIAEGELVKARKELRELKERHERQVRSIGALISEQESMRTAIHNRDTEITVLKQRVKDLDDFLVTRTYERDKARAQVEELENDPLPESLAVQAGRIRELERQLEELREDERCDCAPNLALAACKKKLEQLEGMLEAQRRNTRELGVTLQRVRDEKAALQVDLRLREQALGQWQRQAKDQQDIQRRKNRALSLVRRAATILDTVQVSGIESTFTEGQAPEPDWSAAQFLRAPSWQQQHQATRAKKAEPRKCEASFPGVHGGHRCERQGDHVGRTGHMEDHRCHCGWVWD